MIVCVVILFSCLTGTVLEATPITYQASLDGAQVSPVPTGSLATGFGTITVDSTTHLLMFAISWSNLGVSPVGLHIHCCAPVGANGLLAINFGGFPATSGMFVQTVDLTVAATYNGGFLGAHGGTAAQAEADLLASLAAGNVYLDINNSQFGGGEIRGQVSEAPEPATLLLLATGLASIAACAAWRNRTETI
jgi:hypothetical protein